MKIDALSVFFPAYNEEKNIASTVEKALLVLKDLKLKNYEVMVVNDGSKDNTAKVVEGLVKKDKHVRLINHEQNGGYGEALKTGFYSAKYPWITVTDSDGQFDFADIKKLLEKTDQAEVVWGYRIDRNDPPLRIVMGLLWTLLSNIILGIRIKDVDCAFKLVKKEVIETIPKLQSTRGGMISPELLAKAKKSGFKMAEVGVCHYPRKEGQQTGASFKVMVRSFVDLFKLAWKIR